MSASMDVLHYGSIAVIALFVTVVVLMFGVIIHHLVTDRQRRRNRERFESVAVALAPYVVANSAELERVVAAARKKSGDQAVALVLRRARFDLASPVNVRITAILEDMGEVEHLLREATSRRDWKRTIAVRGLGECGGERATQMLISASNDASNEVRRAARDGLLSDGSPHALHAAITSFIRDLPRRSGWRRSFYARLAVVGAQELGELIEGGQLVGAEEKLALEALGDAGRPVALKLALERKDAAEGEMRASAIRVIGKVGTEREMQILIDALDDPEWFVRAASARSVEWLMTLRTNMAQSSSRYSAAERLGKCLSDSSWWVRANAARALSRIGEAGIAVLMRNVDNTDRFARDAAIAALAMAPMTSDTRLNIKQKLDSAINTSTAFRLSKTAIRPIPGGTAS